MNPHAMRKLAAGVCALTTALGSGAVLGQNLVRNGGFETGDFTNWDVTRKNAADAFGVDSANPHDGEYAAFFGGFEPEDSISQTISTTPGASYRVSFFLDSEYSSYDSASFEVLFGGREIFKITDADPNFTYMAFDFVETASSDATVLSFSAYNRPWFYTLDGVSVVPSAASPIPEPSVYVLMLLGLALAAAIKVRDHRLSLMMIGSTESHGMSCVPGVQCTCAV